MIEPLAVDHEVFHLRRSGGDHRRVVDRDHRQFVVEQVLQVGVDRLPLGLVDDGDVIAVDSSTTAYYLAHELLDRQNLLVITNSLRVTALLAEHSTARVLVLGGVLRRSAGSLVGPVGDVLSSRGRIAKGFFGLVALSPLHGLMDISAEETQTKQALAKSCAQIYGLFHSAKVYGFGLHSFALPSLVTGLYTDDDAPPEFARQWVDLGVKVTLTPYDSPY